MELTITSPAAPPPPGHPTPSPPLNILSIGPWDSIISSAVYVHDSATIFILLSGFFVVFLFYVHGKHLRSCRDGQLT